MVEQLESLCDLDARFCTKHGTQWLRYEVHYTETCAFDQAYTSLRVKTEFSPHRQCQENWEGLLSTQPGVQAPCAGTKL